MDSRRSSLIFIYPIRDWIEYSRFCMVGICYSWHDKDIFMGASFCSFLVECISPDTNGNLYSYEKLIKVCNAITLGSSPLEILLCRICPATLTITLRSQNIHSPALVGSQSHSGRPITVQKVLTRHFRIIKEVEQGSKSEELLKFSVERKMISFREKSKFIPIHTLI